jgi:hypothetical protein
VESLVNRNIIIIMSYIYISIPKGWAFDNENYNADVFVRNKEELVQIIPLQFLIKECLRTKKRHEQTVTLPSTDTHGELVMLYFKRPPNTLENFIRYAPNRNGKLPAKEIDMVNGLNVQSLPLAHSSGYLWFQLPENQKNLSEWRLSELQEKALIQRENQRHTGDSPCLT